MHCTSINTSASNLALHLHFIIITLVIWLDGTYGISCPHGAACDDYSSRAGATDSISRHQAIINVTFIDPATHLPRTDSIPDGQFGIASRLSNESGMMVHVKMTMLAERRRCVIDSSEGAESGEPWIALMDRRTCRAEGLQEALTAVREAAAVVWYSDVEEVDSFGRLLYEISINRKTYKDTVDDAVVVFMPRSHGERLARLIGNGTGVHMSISVGRIQLILLSEGVNTTSMLFLSISFIVLMIISMAWLIFYYIQRSRHTYAKQRLSRKMMSAAKKALAHMPLKTVRGGDEPMEPGFDLCVICIEGYRSSDIARILPCKHVFHKQCIDPWLLQQRNCPICKADILKAYGLQVCRSREAAAPSTVENELGSASYAYSDTGPQESSRDFDSEGVEIVHFQLAHIECHGRDEGEASGQPEPLNHAPPGSTDVSGKGTVSAPAPIPAVSGTPTVSSTQSHPALTSSTSDPFSSVVIVKSCVNATGATPTISGTFYPGGTFGPSVSASPSATEGLAVGHVSNVPCCAQERPNGTTASLCPRTVYTNPRVDSSTCRSDTYTPRTDTFIPYIDTPASYVDMSASSYIPDTVTYRQATPTAPPTAASSTPTTRSSPASGCGRLAGGTVERVGLLSSVGDVSDDDDSSLDSETDDESSSGDSSNQSHERMHRSSSNRNLQS